jgi:hypothetical protein
MAQARQNSQFKETSKWMMSSGLLISILTMLSGCSFKKNSGENQAKTPDVIVVEAPIKPADAVEVRDEDIDVTYVPLEFGKYKVVLRFLQDKNVYVRVRQLTKKSPPQYVSSPGLLFKKDTQYSQTCMSGHAFVWDIDVYANSPVVSSTIQKEIKCPVDAILSGTYDTHKSGQIQAIDGRLIVDDGVVIDAGTTPFVLKPRVLKINGTATIKATRTRATFWAKHNVLLARRLADPVLAEGSENFCLKHRGVDIFEYAKSLKLKTRGRVDNCLLPQFHDVPNGHQAIWARDQHQAQLQIKSELANGALVLQLFGEDGVGGLSGNELREKHSIYQDMLRENQPTRGRDGRPGESRMKGVGPVCIRPNENGGDGEPGKVPGIDGESGFDGMPSASAHIEIKNGSGLKVSVFVRPGLGGRGGLGGDGQPGSAGGSPGKDPYPYLNCRPAKPGNAGGNAAPGVPGADGSAGGCGLVQIGREFAEPVRVEGLNPEANACLSNIGGWFK